MYEPGGVYTPLDVREKDQIPTATQLGQYKSSQAQEGGQKRSNCDRFNTERERSWAKMAADVAIICFLHVIMGLKENDNSAPMSQTGQSHVLEAVREMFLYALMLR
jgi:hypothetical protein